MGNRGKLRGSWFVNCWYLAFRAREECFMTAVLWTTLGSFAPSLTQSVHVQSIVDCSRAARVSETSQYCSCTLQSKLQLIRTPFQKQLLRFLSLVSDLSIEAKLWLSMPFRFSSLLKCRYASRLTSALLQLCAETLGFCRSAPIFSLFASCYLSNPYTSCT